MLLRGGSFRQSYQILQTIQQAAARPTPAARRRFRIAVVHGGGLSPGMNTVVRAAVRLGLDRGYTVLAVKNQISPPTINIFNQDPECDLDYCANAAREMKIEHAVKNNFGFGGTNGTLVFKRASF